MPVIVRFTVTNPDDLLRASPDGYGAGSLTRLERGTAEGGPFAEIATEPIVSLTNSYEVGDDTGTTTHWYRSRYSNAGGTVFSEYSPAFTPTVPDSYANLDDLLLGLPHLPTETPGGSRRLAAMERALIDAKRKLDNELGVDFFRHPAAGTEVFYLTGDGTSRLHVHDGIVSASQIRIRTSPSASFVTLTSTGYDLDPPSPLADEPYFHVILNGSGTYTTWPTTYRGVEVTGVRGWAAVPVELRDANIAWARQSLAADPSFPGGIVGPDELGRPVGPNRLPDPVWRLKRSHVERFIGCHV